MTDDEITALIATAHIVRDARTDITLWTMDLRPEIAQTISVEAADEPTARSLISVDNVAPMLRDQPPAPLPDIPAQLADLQQTVADLSSTIQGLVQQPSS